MVRRRDRRRGEERGLNQCYASLFSLSLSASFCIIVTHKYLTNTRARTQNKNTEGEKIRKFIEKIPGVSKLGSKTA